VTRATLAGQVAVVAGATSAIGQAVCTALANTGARLCLLGRDPDALDVLAKSLRGSSDDAVGIYRMDFKADETMTALTERLEREVDRIDVLIHSAGIFEMGSHDEASIAALDHQYRTNVRGPYLLTQALLPRLRASHGQVVFMNSTVGLEARAGVGQYASTQHALRAVADALRAEVNADGVRVLTIYLGRTATARQARIFRLEGRPYSPELLVQPDDVAQMVMAALLLPRTAEVTEIRIRPLVKSY
jgi:NADP-dependent 3-hydroxy acid dehydrogenase YdfG